MGPSEIKLTTQNPCPIFEFRLRFRAKLGVHREGKYFHERQDVLQQI